MPFPTYNLRGPSYEIGYTHGKVACGQIQRSIQTYKAMFHDFAGLSWDEALRCSREYLPSIKAYAPDLIEEMQGIADGAKLQFNEILALNCRSELALNNASGGCTSLAFVDAERVFLAQNWDWKATQSEAVIVLVIEGDNKPKITMITEAGIVGKIGFNSYALGVCLNALVSTGAKPGVPLHIVLRRILESKNLGDAVKAVDIANIASAANFLIASGEGEALNIEATPNGYQVLARDNHFICHTNHFLSPLFATEDLGKSLLPDTFVRLSRVTSLIRAVGKIKTPQQIQAILSDHLNFPNSICRHEDGNDSVGKRMATVFSVIMDLQNKKFLYCKGKPCGSEFEEIKAKI